MAIEYLKETEYFIFKKFRSDIFYQEMTLHYPRFELLIDYLVKKEVEQIKQVDGLTIDEILKIKQLYTGLSSVLIQLINDRVDNKLSECACIGRWCEGEVFCGLNRKNLLDIPLSPIKDIHVTSLHLTDPIDIDKNLLSISTDGRYLYGIDRQGKKIVWDMETGKEVDISHRNSRMFVRTRTGDIRDKDSVVDGKNKYAIIGNSLSDYQYISDPLSEHKSGYQLTLYKRPTKESRIAMLALKNCCYNKEKLHALLNSDLVTKILTGFVQENFKNLIHEMLRGL